VPPAVPRKSGGRHALETGADTESFRILASFALERLPNPFEIERYFIRSLEELSLSRPEPGVWMRQYGRDVVEGILSGETSPGEGCHEMYDIVAALFHPEDLLAWAYLDYECDMAAENPHYKSEVENEIRREAKAFLDANSKEFF
jgi:hypothetical protein